MPRPIRHERRSALARALEGDDEYILPVGFHDTDLDGQPLTIGYLDLRLSLHKDQLAKTMGLLSTSEGGDVALIRPENANVFMNVDERETPFIAAPGQVAVDCLSGSGRVPAEGEALID